jgi:AcrR family transcriptional regulator
MADSACNPTDPRIRRTRELLQQALTRLLETQDFDSLSVQEITDAAGVNRATFYAHYPDKFALLECVVAARFNALLTQRGIAFDGSCSSALQAIVLGVCDFLAQTLSSATLSSRPDPERARRTEGEVERPAAWTPAYPQNQMAPHMESAIVAVVRNMLLDGIRRHPPASGDAPELIAATASWAIYGAAREWVNTPNRPPSDQIAATVYRLIAPVLHPQPAHPEAATASPVPV